MHTCAWFYFYDGIGNSELTTFSVNGLTRVRAGVLPLSIGNSERTMSDLVRDHPASRLRAHMAPIQPPVDERHWEALRAALQLKCVTQANCKCSNRWLHYFRLNFFSIKKKTHSSISNKTTYKRVQNYIQPKFTNIIKCIVSKYLNYFSISRFPILFWAYISITASSFVTTIGTITFVVTQETLVDALISILTHELERFAHSTWAWTS